MAAESAGFSAAVEIAVIADPHHWRLVDRWPTNRGLSRHARLAFAVDRERGLPTAWVREVFCRSKRKPNVLFS
jgi:hypothetical protein